MRKVFLTAEWRYLLMLNYTIDPVVLKPLVPHGTELDFFQGRTFVSLVGFRFLQTRVCSVPLPFHRDFEEVNLRFYVRRKVDAEWRRGVVFVRELVPRRMIAFIARTVYGEPYRALPMRHSIEHAPSELRVEYGWRRETWWECLHAAARGPIQEIAAGSEEEFITEHFWGYTARGGGAREYQVEHPRWRVWPAFSAGFDADIATLYSPAYVEALSAPPSSAFIAEGSPVVVRHGTDLAG